MSEEQNYSSPDDPLMSVDPEDTGSESLAEAQLLEQTPEERGFLVPSDFSINPALLPENQPPGTIGQTPEGYYVMSDGTIQYPPGMEPAEELNSSNSPSSPRLSAGGNRTGVSSGAVTASSSPCTTGALPGTGSSIRVGNVIPPSAMSGDVIAPPYDGTILIFGDSQVGNERGVGNAIKSELVRKGYTASKIHVSMNCGKTTSWLLSRLTENLLNQEPEGCGYYWDGPTETSIDFSTYDFAFIISGGNDTQNPRAWSGYLQNSVPSIAEKYRNKLVWIGPVPSTSGGRHDYINGQRLQIPSGYRTRDGKWSGEMTNPDPSAAERREVYNILLKEKIDSIGTISYLDARDIANNLTGTTGQLSISAGHRFNTRWPNLGDGIHIMNGPGGTQRAQAIGAWIANSIGEPQTQSTESDNISNEDGTTSNTNEETTTTTTDGQSDPNMTTEPDESSTTPPDDERRG